MVKAVALECAPPGSASAGWLTPSFWKTRLRWNCTVFSVICRFRAIMLLGEPFASSASTSNSRVLNALSPPRVVAARRRVVTARVGLASKMN